MKFNRLNRRAFLRGSTTAALVSATTNLFWTPELLGQMPMPTASGGLDQALDAYVAAYMAAMNAPGMTLGLTDAAKTIRTAISGTCPTWS